MNRRIALALALTIALPVHAETLQTVVSAPGADKVAFLHSVGAQLRTFADKRHFEACGALATDGSRWGVVVTTSGSHIACAIDMALVPAGMHYIGQTIHTHGTDGSFAMNAADRRFFNAPVSIRIMRGQDLWHFSATDYAGEPGYLALPNGGLLFQHGPNTAEIVR